MSNRKSSWLQGREGVEVFDPHANDGVFVFINQGVASWGGNKPYTRLTFCGFYKDKEGKRIWKHRPVKIKDKSGKERKYLQYDLVSVDLTVAGQLVEAIQKVTGKGVKPAKPSGDENIVAKYLNR